ncbi:hypothetical protein B0J12DRAFT_339715 [Macrophomina phaseolina]|uniref:Uncharacterized protein n=1 Tax=Macrophomina phaseolina TaxID=35725 RepID=A0ABQ8GLV4_9PEZI|nr:hypothetical protein B0J12DRAFT_339715 [Macrophomina phaseolina]
MSSSRIIFGYPSWFDSYRWDQLDGLSHKGWPVKWYPGLVGDVSSQDPTKFSKFCAFSGVRGRKPELVMLATPLVASLIREAASPVRLKDARSLKMMDCRNGSQSSHSECWNPSSVISKPPKRLSMCSPPIRSRQGNAGGYSPAPSSPWRYPSCEQPEPIRTNFPESSSSPVVPRLTPLLQRQPAQLQLQVQAAVRNCEEMSVTADILSTLLRTEQGLSTDMDLGIVERLSW